MKKISSVLDKYIASIILCVCKYKISPHLFLPLAFIYLFLTLIFSSLFLYIFISMRSSLISLVALIAIIFSPLTALAEIDSGSTITGATAAPVVGLLPLRMSGSVVVPEIRTIEISFNQPIQIDSLRVQITDLATSETIKIASITGTMSPMTATIQTATDMSPGASYKLTIRTAFAENGTTIAAGTDSIKEFSAPLDLMPLTAAPNPSAVIASTGSTPPVAPTSTGPIVLQASPPPGVATGAMTPKVPEALPVTGTETTLIIILAAIAASGLLIFRKKN
jgi:LPXTG-motif cell wall-anchored protein